MVLTILLVKGHIVDSADRKVLTSETVPAQSWLVSLYMDCPPNLGITCPSNEEVEVSILFWFRFMHNHHIDTPEVFRNTKLTWPLRLQAFLEAVHAGDIFWNAAPRQLQHLLQCLTF